MLCTEMSKNTDNTEMPFLLRKKERKAYFSYTNETWLLLSVVILVQALPILTECKKDNLLLEVYLREQRDKMLWCTLCRTSTEFSESRSIPNHSGLQKPGQGLPLITSLDMCFFPFSSEFHVYNCCVHG